MTKGFRGNMKPGLTEKYKQAAEDGSIPDDENPLFLFQGTTTKLLVMGINKEFSFAELARQELANRGLNLKGEWVGFKNAAAQRKPARRKGKKL
jgi:hypothetical protein